MRLVLHKIVMTFTTFDKKSTIFGDTGPSVLHPESSPECVKASETSMEINDLKT